MTRLMCSFQFIIYVSSGDSDCLFRKCEQMFPFASRYYAWAWLILMYFVRKPVFYYVSSDTFPPFSEVSKRFEYVFHTEGENNQVIVSRCLCSKLILYNALKNGSLHLLQVTSLSKIIYTFVMLTSIYAKNFLRTNYYTIFNNTQMGSIVHYNLLNNIRGSTTNQTIVKVADDRIWGHISFTTPPSINHIIYDPRVPKATFKWDANWHHMLPK